ncbi:MAG: signal recognition particle receptor subunit alpha, partial [Bacteroidota bacterium]
MRFFSKTDQDTLHQGLTKTKQSLWARLSKVVAGKSTVDTEVLDDLEELLIGADVGIETTVKIIERIEQRVARDKYLTTAELDQILQEEVAALLKPPPPYPTDTSHPPYVILVVGVNGVGKTT